MIYLITQREGKDKHGADIDVLEGDYIRYFEKLNVFLIPISNFSNLEVLKEHLASIYFDGIILTGGGDVPLDMFTDFISSHQPQNKRDLVETWLLEYALEKNKPILGICRGFQFINGYLGGKTDVLTSESVQNLIGIDHIVVFDKIEIKVNHYHNHVIYINKLSEDLSPIGIDPQLDCVEAFKSSNKKILAMQFHPERKFEDESANAYILDLICSFLETGGII